MLIWVVGIGVRAFANALRNYILVITVGTILRVLVSFQHIAAWGEGQLVRLYKNLADGVPIFSVSPKIANPKIRL